MKREEALLHRACEELAREEAEQLEKSLTFAEARQAEEAYRRHQGKALKLIRGRASVRWGRYLAAAAAFALLAGGVYLSLSRNQPEIVPGAHPPTASAAPYYTSAPTETPVPMETPPAFPTETPLPTENPTDAPTNTPSPTEAPTATPPPSIAPEGWTGLYFPGQMPAGSELRWIDQAEGRHTAAYTLEGREILFTEYDLSALADVPERAEIGYVQLSSGVIALRTEIDGVVTLSWDQDGRTLSLSWEDADPTAIADSVERIGK